MKSNSKEELCRLNERLLMFLKEVQWYF